MGKNNVIVFHFTKKMFIFNCLFKGIFNVGLSKLQLNLKDTIKDLLADQSENHFNFITNVQPEQLKLRNLVATGTGIRFELIAPSRLGEEAAKNLWQDIQIEVTGHDDEAVFGLSTLDSLEEQKLARFIDACRAEINIPIASISVRI